MNRYILLGTAAILLLPTVSFAQTTLAPKADDTITEVVVTAQKRSENVREVPKSVQVITTETLKAAGVNQLSDLANIAPQLQLGNTGNMPGQRSMVLRGIGTLPISQTLPGQVGIVLDDVPQPTWASLANELSDVQQIEVLSGPQSTLSGRNAAAGLINIVTQRPSRHWTGKIAAEQTSDQQSRLNGFLSGPITDSLNFSVSAFENTWDGNVKNLTLDRYLNGQDTRGGRGKLEWRPTDKLTITATAFKQRTDAATVGGQSAGAFFYADPTAMVLSRFDTTPAANRQNIVQLEPGVTFGPNGNASYDSPRNTSVQSIDTGGSLRIDYELNGGTFSAITAYSTSKQHVDGDFVAINVPVAAADRFLHQSGDVTNTSQEFRYASPKDGKFTYLVGAIYNKVESQYNYLRSIAPTDWYRVANTATTAVFARGTYKFTDNTSLTGGLRYQNDDIDYSWLFRDTFHQPNTPLLNAGKSSYGFWNGEASLQHKFGKRINGYITVASAQTGEAFDTEDNGVASTGAKLTPLASEKVTNIEAGFKGDFFARRVSVNADVFSSEYSNFPVQTVYIDPTNAAAAPVFKVLAVGKVKTEGLELTANARPTDALRLMVNFAYVNATIEDFSNAPCYKLETVAQGCVTGPGGASVQTNLSGNPLPYSPKYKLNASANYTVNLPDSIPFNGRIGAFYRYQSEVQYDVLGNPFTVQKGFGLLNLTAGIDSRDGGWSLEAFVNNVTNKHTYTNLFDSQFWDKHVIVGTPSRDWGRYGGVRLTANF